MTHVEGDVDPVRDMEIIHEELRLKDLEYVDKTVDNLERVVVRGGDKSRKAEYVRWFSAITNLLFCVFFWKVVHQQLPRSLSAKSEVIPVKSIHFKIENSVSSKLSK